LVSAFLVESWRSDLKSQNQCIIGCVQVAFICLKKVQCTMLLQHYISSVIRASDCCEQGNGMKSHWGHTFFLCPKLVTCWTQFSFESKNTQKQLFRRLKTYQKIQPEKSVVTPAFTDFKVRCCKEHKTETAYNLLLHDAKMDRILIRIQPQIFRLAFTKNLLSVVCLLSVKWTVAQRWHTNLF